ncbi:putative uncharacterized protein [Rhodococcus sp. AW25M09]|uniref:hypothetical protein n=1 Tax=Rhodococcus sp. AW25M09 TaxID=1268303 RepID=UPI0002AC716E|nr:hypothetical protein [Rhodococcus sp. AW25M09]CCQ13776.1 putative uncharacterized protein [Rhodococcus sp. AW25M09]
MTNVAEENLGRLRERTAVSASGTTGSAAARESIDIALHHRLKPLTVRVTGRRGVGKSAILALLESIPLDADGLDVRSREDSGTDGGDRTQSGESEGNVLVYVFAGAVSPVDSAFLSSRPSDSAGSGGTSDGVVVVLTKADTLDDPQAAASAASEQLGRTVLPVMGTTAVGLRGIGRSGAPLVMADVRAVAATDLGPADLLTVDRFHAADIALSTRRREALVDCIELRGLALLVGALRRRPAASDRELERVLADASGADALIAAVSAAVSTATATRDADLHRSLQQISARHRHVRSAVESYLASDEAVAAEMRCAALQLGVPIETGTERDTAEQAVLWKQRAAAAEDLHVRRSALALCRGYVRMLGR